MPDLFQILLLFGVGVLTSVQNVMAGGGSTLSLPVLIFLGLDGATANGTNRVGIVVQGIFSVLAFRRKRFSRLRQSAVLGLLTLPGAVLGAFAAVRISDVWFERILGIVMIGIVLTMLLPRSKGVMTSPEGRDSIWIYPALFGIGFYGGFIQVGVGFLLMAALFHLLRLDLVFVNMHKVAIVLIFTVPALLVFVASGNVNWPLGLALAAGNGVGGWWAAHFSIRGGERVIRVVLVLAILVMALGLLGLF